MQTVSIITFNLNLKNKHDFDLKEDSSQLNTTM